MSYRFPPEHYRAKAMIAACAAVGAEIEYLPDAPRFRYFPPEAKPVSSFSNGSEHGSPGPRGSVSFKRGPHAKGLRNWQPSKVSLDPMYDHPMAGDDHALTHARKCYAAGDPAPLRLWLQQFTARPKGRGTMTPTEFKAIRERAGLTQSQLATRLRISDSRVIRRYEAGEREISGPVSLLMEQLEAGH